jgi:HEAT repeat protein
MNLLMATWYLAVSLAAVAIVGAFIIIVARLIRMAIETRNNRWRAALLAELLAGIEVDRAPLELINSLQQHRRQAIELLVELTAIIRGATRERLLAVYKQANLNIWLAWRLRAWSRRERRVAAELLGLFDDPSTTAALQEALKDRDEDVRLTAALGLAERQEALPMNILLDRLQAGTREHSLLLRRMFELIALKRPGDVLEVAEGRVGHPSLRPTAIDALGNSGRAELAEAIAAMAQDPERNIRASVLRALGVLGHPASAKAIAAGLRDANWEVRVRAIDAVRRVQLVDLVPVVAELLDDEAWWVRFRAAEALATLGESGRRALQKAASDGPEVTRHTATMILAERGLT